MKLRNKLIPLLSVVASTGVVAPIATSCGVSSLDMVDIVNGYTPTIAKAKANEEGLTETEAEDLYFTHLAANPEIIRQDILKFEADRLPQRIHSIECPNANQEYIATKVMANIGVSDVTARRVEATIEGTKTHFYAISCDLKYETSITALSMDGTLEYTYNQVFSMTLKDIPTVVWSSKVQYRDGSTVDHWFLSNWFYDGEAEKPSKLLSAVPGWSYSFDDANSVITKTIDSEGKSITKVAENHESGTLTRADQITNVIKQANFGKDFNNKYLYFQSYHLDDIAVKGEGGGGSATGDSLFNISNDGYVHGNLEEELVLDNDGKIVGIRGAYAGELLNLPEDLVDELKSAQGGDFRFYLGTLCPIESVFRSQTAHPATSGNPYLTPISNEYTLTSQGSYTYDPQSANARAAQGNSFTTAQLFSKGTEYKNADSSFYMNEGHGGIKMILKPTGNCSTQWNEEVYNWDPTYLTVNFPKEEGDCINIKLANAADRIPYGFAFIDKNNNYVTKQYTIDFDVIIKFAHGA